MSVKHITLVGSFGASNIGDEAILESTLQMLHTHSESLGIHVLSPTPEDTQEFYHAYSVTSSVPIPFGVRSIIKKSPAFIKSLKILRSTDIVFFPGGGLFTDNESIYAVLLWALHFFFFKFLLGKKVVFGGQSIGPLKSFLAKNITRWVLASSDGFFVRDEESLLCIKKEFPKYVSKVSLLLDPVCFIDTSVEHKGVFTTTKKPLQIALSLRPWHGSEHKLIHALGKIFKKISETQPIHLHLIPMQYKGSEDITPLQHMSYVLHEMNIPSTLHAPRSYTEVLQILSDCQASIGMRLHFLILSALSHTPLLALSYSTKVEGFLKRINLHSSFNIASLHTAELEATVEHFIKSYSDQQTYLDVFIAQTKAKKDIEANTLLSALGLVR
ncbi:MAG: polysaccharide pyruvyl transferase family protein [Candidatus Gracilibacteria bacterium]